MPFTFSHPAIILPLLNKRRKIFSASGLIMGSLAPDFESFIRIGKEKIYSHTWTGMFWYDLPLAIVLCMVFHLIVRDPLIDHLPLSMQERFEPYRNFKWLSYCRKHFILVIFSLLVGIASHLLWDAFTHLNLRYPDDTSSTYEIHHIRLYIILQYASSLIGLAVIAMVIRRMPRYEIKKRRTQKFKYWLFITLLAALISAYLSTAVIDENDVYGFVQKYIIFSINVSISGLLSGLIVVSLFYKIYAKKNDTLS